MALVAARRRGPSGSSTTQGFSLVGLIVTLTIVVTLSGVATIYYQSVVDDQQIAIAANELDEYSKAIRAYMLKTRRNLNPVELEPFDDVYAGGVGDIPDDGYTLDFLVDEGLYREINRDPWGHIYRLDPNAATVYSLGPDPSDPSDDIIRPYSRGSGQLTGGSEENPIPDDDIPPVISGIQPVGVIKVQDPVVRASFYDHFGGTIDQTTVRMFLDQVDLAGDPGLTTDSAGQILYTTGGGFSEGVHTVVVQVADTNGNLARREWTFTVDTNPAYVEIHQPVQGEALRGTFNAEIEAFDDTLKKVTVRLDFGDVSDRFLGLSPPLSDAVWTNAIPPNNGGGSRYRGIWGPINTVLAPPNGIPDGTHFFTLLAEDFSGRVISTQSQFIVDNTSPTIDLSLGVDPFAQPPTGPTSPQVLATTVAHFETRGLDNIRIKEIRYWFRDVGNNLVGTRGSVAVTGPEIMVPIDWLGDPAGDWGALYNSGDEVASTTADASASAHIPLTLPEGEFRFEAWAVDLAGNESSRVSTTFIINLSAAGITSLVLFDQPPGVNPAGPLNVASQTISGMEYSDWNVWSNGTYGPVTVQTTGHLRYQLLRTEPSSLFSASIDDFTTNPVPAPGRDGVYSVPTFGDPVGDWIWSLSGIPDSTGTQMVHNFPGGPPAARYGADELPAYPYKYGGYSVHRDQVGPEIGAVAQDRRGGAAAPFPGGQLEAKIKIDYGLSGQERTAFTSFYVDTEYPLIDASNSFVVEVQPAGTLLDLAPMGYQVNQLTQQSPTPEIRFGGYIEDRLCATAVGCDQSKARVVNLWGRRFPLGTEPLLQDPNGWEQLWPHPASQPESPIATFGAPLSQAGAGPMNLTSSDPSKIDGQYAFQFKAVDGAGHTTAWQRDVLVNAVGPLVDFISIDNSFTPAPTPMVPAVAQVTTSTIQEPFLAMSLQVSDEVAIERIEYRVTKIGPPPPFGSTIIPVSPATVVPVNGIQVFQDQLGSVFRPKPTSYLLEVWGVSGGKQGIIAQTRLEFEFLTDLAIYAPNYNDGSEVAMRKDEQKQIADYLYSNVDNVQSKAVYDHSGKVIDTGGVGESDIGAWMSARQSDGETDVLVILDAADWDMTDQDSGNDDPWDPLKDFLSSSDHNVVVFSGGVSPGPNVHDGTSLRDQYVGSNDDQLRDNWVQAVGIKDATRDKNMHADRAGEDTQVPTALAQMLLPSLSTYRNEDLMGGYSDFAYITSGKDASLDEDSNEGLEWTKLNLTNNRDIANNRELLSDLGEFRDGHKPGGTDRSGAAFILEENGGGLFANFYSYGHMNLGEGGTILRKAAIAAGPVIEEFIEQYLVGQAKPDAIGSTVAFTAKKNNHEVDPGLGGVNNNARDVFTWPFYEGGQDYFGVLTVATLNDTRGAAAVMDMTPDGGAYLVFAQEQVDTDFDTTGTDPTQGYVIRSDSSRLPLYRNSVTARNGEPVWGRLSEDGRRAVILGSSVQDPALGVVVVQHAETSGVASPRGMVAWLYDLTSATNYEDAVQITVNGAAGAEGTIRADVSGDGSKVVLISDTKMHSVDSQVSNGFLNHSAMPPGQRSLMVYDIGSDSYTLVNDPSSFGAGGGEAKKPTNESCPNFFDNVLPEEAVISFDGSIVVWVGTGSNGCLGNQSQILISRNISGTWHTGKITDCPDGTACQNGEGGFHGLDIAEIGGDVPQVIFTSRGNFRSLNVGGSYASPESSGGADPTGGGGGGPATPPNVEDSFTPAAGATLDDDDFESGTYLGGSGWTGGWTETDDDGLFGNGAVKLGATACAGVTALVLDGAQQTPSGGGASTKVEIEDDWDCGGDNCGSGFAEASWFDEGGVVDTPTSGAPDGACVSGNFMRTVNMDDGKAYERDVDLPALGAGESLWLVFDASSSATGANDGIQLQFPTGIRGGNLCKDISNADTILTEIQPGACQLFEIDISAYAGATDRTLCFRGNTGGGDDTVAVDNFRIERRSPGAGGAGCAPGTICDDLEDGWANGHSAEWSGSWSTGGSVTWTQPAASGCGDGTVLRGDGPATNVAEAVRQMPDISGMTDPHVVFDGRMVCGSGTDCGLKWFGVIDAESGPANWVWQQKVTDVGHCKEYAVPIRNSARHIYIRAANSNASGAGEVDWAGSDYFTVDNIRIVDGSPQTGGGSPPAYTTFLEHDFSDQSFSGGTGGWSAAWEEVGDNNNPATGNIQMKPGGETYGMFGEFLEIPNAQPNVVLMRRLHNTLPTGSEYYLSFLGRFDDTGSNHEATMWEQNGDGWYSQFQFPVKGVTKRWVIPTLYQQYRISPTADSGQNHDTADVMRVDDIQIVQGCPSGWACSPMSGDPNGGGGGFSGNWVYGGGTQLNHYSGSTGACRNEGYSILANLDNRTLYRDLDTTNLAGARDLWISLAIAGKNNDQTEQVTLRARRSDGSWVDVHTFSGADGCDIAAFDIPDDTDRIAFEDTVGDDSWRGDDDDGFRLDSIIVYDAHPDGNGVVDPPSGGGGGGGGSPTCGSGSTVCDDFSGGGTSSGCTSGACISGGSGWNGPWTSNDYSASGANREVYAQVCGGGGSDGHMELWQDFDPGDYLRRPIDPARWGSATQLRISFDWRDDGSGARMEVRGNSQASGWQSLGILTAPDTSCQAIELAIPFGDLQEIEFRFLDNDPRSNIDDIVIWDDSPPNAPGPRILRMFGTEVTGASLTFTREYAGLASGDTGYQIEVTTDNGISWSQLIDFPNGNGAACWTNPGVALPAGSDGIRISATGSGNTTGVDTIKFDDIAVVTPGDPYSGGTVEWVGSWTETGDIHELATNGDHTAGYFQVVAANACDGGDTGHLRVGTSSATVGTLSYLERTVDLSSFTAPTLEFERYFDASAMQDDDEIVRVRAGTGSPPAILYDYFDTDGNGGNPGGETMGCQVDSYPIAAFGAATNIRFEIPAGGLWEAGDRMHIDDIVIRDGAAVCGSLICDDFEDLDSDGDRYNNGAGWSGPWVQTGGNTSSSAGSLYINNNSVDDCRDGYHFQVNRDFDGSGGGDGGSDPSRSLARDFDAGIFTSLNNPALVFSAQLECPSGDCNERWSIDFKDGAGAWQRGFYYAQGYADAFPPLNTTADTDPLGCNQYVVPFPKSAQGIRIVDRGGGWDGPGSGSGPDFLYIDNIKVIDLPDGCGTGQICDDFDHDRLDDNNDGDIEDGSDGEGGGGWNGDWTVLTDRGDEIYEDNGGNNFCRGNDSAMLVTDRIENNRGVSRTITLPPGLTGSPSFQLSLWVQTSNYDGSDDTMEIRAKDGGTYLSPDPLLSITGGGCRQYTVSIPGPDLTELEFRWPNGMDNSAITRIDNIVITRSDVLGGGAGGGLHAQVGLYIWTGSFGGSGNQFFRVVDPQDAAAQNPRISPDGRTFVFETTADQVHGVFGFDSYDADKDTRVQEQVFDFGEESTIAGSGSWGSNDRKIFRGRFQKMSNTIFGYSSILQLVAPLSRQGDTGSGGLEFTPSGSMYNQPWNGYTLPVTGN